MSPSWLYWPAAAAPFVPTDLADLRCWLDASDSTTLFDANTGGSLPGNNGSIGRWEDKSGNSLHADDAVNTSNAKVTTNRPTRVTSAQNSLDAIAFASGQLFDHNTARGMLRNRSAALFVAVGKYGGSLTDFRFMWGNINKNTSGQFRSRSSFSTGSGGSGVFRWQSARLDADGVITITSANSTADTNWHVFVGYSDWATNGHTKFFIDGTQIGSTTSFSGSLGNTSDTDLTSDSNTCTAIGDLNRSTSSTQNFLASGSRIGELICVAKNSGTISDSDREKIEGYLAHKWGLAGNLPGGHPYKSAAP